MARKSVREFSKVHANVTHLIDLELFYVEQGVKFTNTFGDIDEPFYESMESMYEHALKLIAKHKLGNTHYRRPQGIVKSSRDTGYGFGDQIRCLFEEHLGGL